MNRVRTSRLPMLRSLLAALGYVAVIVVLLVLVWSAVADILDRRRAIAARRSRHPPSFSRSSKDGERRRACAEPRPQARCRSDRRSSKARP